MSVGCYSAGRARRWSRWADGRPACPDDPADHEATVVSTSAPVSTAMVRLGRRAVHDRRLEVVAYHLVGEATGRERGVDRRAEVFVAGMIDIGLGRLANGRDVVIELSDGMLRDGVLAHLPLDRLIVAIGADNHPDDDLAAMLHAARRDGLRLQVADPVAHPHLAAVADGTDWIATDVAAMSSAQRRERLALLRGMGRKVVARGVDRHDVHDDCLEAGFDLFSGTVLARARPVQGRRLGRDRAALLRLVTLLADPDASVDAIEQAVTTSPTLALQVLRFVNSAHAGLRQEVASVRRAVVLVGPQVLRQLAGVLLLLQADQPPEESARVALARAEACAVVAAALGEVASEYRTVGLLSAVDLMLGIPLPEALADLPLTPATRAAVIAHDGLPGRVLEAVLAYASCDWDADVLRAFDQVVLAEAHLTGLARADEQLALARTLAD